ncbi:IS630 transposase-related protein [Candidatus Protochlamydia amoebophila]|uniref:IS630 transposase-related protein n=1 Tax=Candidatus Protochlamydia amoebophila TaxID=362787 RepID=UPI0024B56B91|nr:IS630 transposase-related protein [Candidatus Protochlamydia amoebophila]
MAYSNDLRKSVMQYVELSGSKAKAVTIFGISLKIIWNWVKKKKEGRLAPKVRVVSPRKISGGLLLEFINSHPDAYLGEIAAHLSSP